MNTATDTDQSAASAFGGMLAEPLDIVNIGVESFGAPPAQAGATVTNLQWRPPAGGDDELGMKLAALTANPIIQKANDEAFEKMLSARAILKDVVPAREAIDVLSEGKALLHAGPPIAFDDMAGPMKAGVIGAALLEGWAQDEEDATRQAREGKISLHQTHDHMAVGPMGGIISPSMPVMVVEDPVNGNTAFTNLNEGAGRALRYGALGEDVMKRLHWISERLGPSLGAAIREAEEPIDLRSITAQALQMGDEVHSRNQAASTMTTRELAPGLARNADLGGIEALDFLRTNNYWFLNFSMVASKLGTHAGHNVKHSTLMTTFSRNGVNVGIRVSGLGDQWFTSPAAEVEGLYFPGYGPEDANPDIGDSAITETYGLGGFALAAAPAIVGFVGGTVDSAIRTTEEMATITHGRHREYQIPTLNFKGSPVGVDIRKVVDSGVEPVITTGIAHKEPGIGQIGAGLTVAPLLCFTEALKALEIPEA
ncbi:DUF1116 domain-containing protein [Brachybacterium sp. JHP9]|uniref:DUF1116 domain-containing protein n=1 Tax=Brachybacterium equifaecis TaxID=2910770 RepID=A0ABT0QZI3_9MICO|nr:DUF1116 domain-containing protein [Brachybacterium equifaecis]MCL6423060.1 DUF1116 domain-containing protein [Brachybacterium equifaecis]